jgi:hypothetical protein
MREEQDRWLLANRQSINAKIQRGIEELDGGEGIPDNQLTEYLRKLKPGRKSQVRKRKRRRRRISRAVPRRSA